MAFVLSVVVARLLGRDGLGRFGIISGTISAFTVVATMGMGVAATKLVAQHRSKDPARAGRALVSAVLAALVAGAVVAGILAFCAASVADRLLNDASLTAALRLAGIALFFSAWAAVQAGGLAGIEAFSSSAKVSAVGGLVIFFVSLVGIWFWGFIGAVAAVPIGVACQCLVQEVVLRRELGRAGIPYSYASPFAEARTTLAIGFPAMVSAGVSVPALWLGSVILVRHAGYEQMAVFTVADQWFNLVLMLPVVLGGVLLPVMTHVFSASEEAASQALLRRTFFANMALSAVPLVAVAPWGFLILRLYGPAYPASWMVFSLMVAAGCLSSALSPIAHALTATGRMWLGAGMNLGWSLAYLVLAYLFVAIGGRGALGLALARLLGYAAHAVWSLAYLRRALRGGP